MPLYKVLIDGKSNHGGSLAWSLPRDGQPGEWHSVDGPIRKCERGLHFTDNPARWWKPGCVVYLVEAEGVVGSCDDDTDRKVVCSRARLIREATRAELDALRIWIDGERVLKAGEVGIALGSSSVVAREFSRVVARESSRVVAREFSRVVAWESSSVEAWESSSVEASHNVTIVSWRGSPAIKIVDRAVWIERGDGSSAPIIHTAQEE